MATSSIPRLLPNLLLLNDTPPCPFPLTPPPSPQALALVGEFNDWSPKDGHWAFKNPFGVWELFMPDGADGKPMIPHR